MLESKYILSKKCASISYCGNSIGRVSILVPVNLPVPEISETENFVMFYFAVQRFQDR